MATFLNDTFTDTASTNITSHTGETGATWTKHNSATNSGHPQINGSNELVTTENNVNENYYASGAPASADYSVTLRYTYNGASNNEIAGPGARLATGANTGYFFFYFKSVGGFTAYKYVSGTLTQIGSTVTVALTSGVSYDITLDVTGTTLTGRVQRVSDSNWLTSGGSWQSGAADALSATDSSISAAGKAGFWFSYATGGTRGTITQISAADPASGATETTLTGPSSGTVGVASSNFTAGANGTITGTVTITPSDGGGGGTFSPTTVDISSGTPTATFTYTAASAGAKTISISDNGGLTDAASITYTASAAGTSIGVTNANIYWSPWNWYSDGGGSMAANNVKGSSTYALSNNPGAYLKFRVTLATTGNVVLNFDNAHLSTVSAGDFPQVAVWRDSGAPTVTQLSGTSTQALTIGSSLAAGTYDFVVVFKAAGLSTSDRWSTPRLAVKITGLTIPSDASMAAPVTRSRTMLVFGDSITEGVHNLGTSLAPADQDAGYTWAQFVAAALDCEVGIIGFGGQGYAASGVGSVPAFPGVWDDYYNGVSRLSGGAFVPVPDVVVVAHGENDTTGGSLASTITSTLSAIRTAAGAQARMFCLVPFTGKCRSDFGSATMPSKCRLIDVQLADDDGSHLTYYPGYQSPLHPSILGSAYIAPRLARLMERGGAKATRSASVTLVNASGTAQASLTGLKWAWFDQVTPDLQGPPTDQGTGESTDGSGVLTVSVRTTLASSATGWLVVTDSDGSAATNHKLFAGPVVLS